MAAPRLYVEPAMGAEVFTRDGKKLGTVKEVSGGSFKIGAHWRRDYWLSADEVESANPATVHLLIDDGELWAYKLERPASAAAVVDPLEDGLISAEEREEQRERMEREVAQSHRDLNN